MSGMKEVDCLVEAMQLAAALKARGLRVTVSQSSRRSLYVTWMR